MNPTLSVILVTYNTRELLARCLEALPAALAGVSYEVWVVDNGSADDTVRWLQAQHPEVQVLGNATNRGFAAACNQAMARARGRYLLLLNTDTIPLPDALTALVRYLEAHPEVGIAGGALLNPDGSPQGCAADFPTLWTELLLLTGPIGHRVLGPAFPFHPPAAAARQVDWVSGACLMVRREVVEAIGGLDEGYFMYSEEVDWCWRARQAGWAVAVVPEAPVIHLGSATARRMEGARRRWLYQSKTRFLSRAYGPLAGEIYRLAVWLTTLLKWIAALLLRRPAAPAYRQVLFSEGFARWAATFFTPTGCWLFLLVLLSTVWIFPRWADWNQNSRLDLVLALVEQGTFRIDAYVENTGDYAWVGGHFYSDKAPGLAFAAVPLYAGLRLLIAPLADPLAGFLERLSAFRATLDPEGTGVAPWKVRFAIAQVVLSALVVAVPSATIGVWLHGLLRARFGDHPMTWGLPLAYALATPAFAYANSFVAHQFVAALLMAAFALAWGMHRGWLGERWALLVGFLLGYTVISEYPTALIAAGLGVYTLGARPLRALWLLLAGAFPPMLLAGLHNAVIFGSPFQVGYAYSALWQGVHRQGFFSLRGPSWEALWGITFSPYRGLFFRAPFLLLGFVGLWQMLWHPAWRKEGGMVGWSVGSFLAFNASSVMWDGGFAVGPRYLLPMVPFLALAAGFAFPTLGRYRAGRGVLFLLLLWSLAMTILESLAGQQFPQYQRFPLVEYVWPQWRAGNVARNVGLLLGLHGPLGLLPLFGLWGGGLWRLAARSALRREALPEAMGGEPMSPAQGFSRKALRWGREQVWRWAGWPAALWVLLAVLSRWPLRGRWLYHWDSVNFALALDHFDVARGQPHIPGYPLYVGMGRISRWIFGEAQTALVALSVLGTALGAILIDRLGREWGGPRVGRWAALFWLSSPLVWFYGDVALPHALDAGLILLVVWLAWRCTQGERLHRPLALALAFAAGLRPQNLGFLGPVFLWGLSGQPWRRRGESLLWLAAFTLAWLIPLLALSGGLQAYLAISRAYNAHFWSATLVFGPAGLAALQRNGTKLIAYTAYGLAGAGLALLALRQALPAIRLPSPAFRRIGIGVLLWVTPSLAFYTLIHMGQQGLVLVFLPALLLGAAAAVERGGRWGRSLGMIGVLMNLLLFLAAPERPLGPNGIRLLNREALRRHDATLEARFALLREQFPPERTLVIASQWRFFDAYAPAYRVLPFGLDDPAERPSETWVFFRTEAMGTGAVVLFEPELVRWVRSGSRPWEWFEGAGTRLPGWRWPPGTEWVYGPQGFGLFEGVGASAP